ncbi:hypothetical protein VTK26DRAFT_1388 [Humicola hyalothermophila]
MSSKDYLGPSITDRAQRTRKCCNGSLFRGFQREAWLMALMWTDFLFVSQVVAHLGKCLLPHTHSASGVAVRLVHYVLNTLMGLMTLGSSVNTSAKPYLMSQLERSEEKFPIFIQPLVPLAGIVTRRTEVGISSVDDTWKHPQFLLALVCGSDSPVLSLVHGLAIYLSDRPLPVMVRAGSRRGEVLGIVFEGSEAAYARQITR